MLRSSMVDTGVDDLRHQTTIFLTTLIVLLVGLLSCIFLLAYFVSEQPAVNEDMTVDTSSALYVPRSRATRPTWTTKEPPTVPRNTSVTTPPEQRHLVPSSHLEGNECVGLLCRYVAMTLRANFDFGVEPCNNFYKYVCGKYRETSITEQIQEAIRVEAYLNLKFVEPPQNNQSAFEKASAMYKACVSFASSNQPETMELVRWMNAMNLDFLNMKILQSVDPVEIMVRGSLDFGVGVIISFDPQDTRFDHGKRVIEMSYSSEQEAWLLRRSSKPKHTNANDYARLFRLYGVRHNEDQLRYARKILAYEEQQRQIEKDTINVTQKQFIGIYDLGEHTAPHVTGKHWENLFYKYTEGTYKASHPIWTFLRSTSVIKELFDNQYVGKTGLQYLVAWSIYRQLVEFTEPYRFRDGKKADEACFVHVKDVMNLAILSKFFELVVTPQMVKEVRQLAFRIKNVFSKAVQSSSWLLSSVRTRLFQKLEEVDVLVGSPGDRLEPKFVKRFYAIVPIIIQMMPPQVFLILEALPDVPFNRLFPSWIQGRRLNTHYRWKDQKTKFYDEESVTAFFMGSNTAVIPTAQLLRPFFYEYGPSALKFGGIGTKIGHTLMQGLDDAHLGSEFWKGKDVKKEYTKRMLCLRRSYRSILFVHLSDTENLADLEGAKLAYAAYDSLPEEHKRVKLAGFSASPDQLFFINYCAGWCAWHASTTKQQLPYWARCMVPLKNMPEFSRAFSCAAGTLMNPDEKCSFW